MSSLSDKTSGHRARAPNFTREEQELFTRVIEPYMTIIESKKTDVIKQSDKQRLWTKITEIYNANTTQCSRTIDNLISCYRNMKTKIKKQRSEAKMLLKDPTKTEALVVAIEDNGKDWSCIAEKTNVPMDVCKMAVEGLQQKIQRSDNEHKKHVMGTGGGPSTSDHDPFNRIKKIIGPQIDGLYTQYDGDAKLMKQYQESIPENERVEPVERDFMNKYDLEIVAEDYVTHIPKTQCTQVIVENNDHCNISQELHGTTKMNSNRSCILKKKLSSALNVEKAEKPSKRKQNVNDSFSRLAEEKIELIKLNKEVASEELKERKLSVQLKEMEIIHKKKLYELEILNYQKEIKFKEEMREKEAILMEFKIKAF